MKKFNNFINSKKAKIVAFLLTAAITASPVTAFAAENDFPITSDMLTGVTSNFNNAISVAAPVGIQIMCVTLGVKFVPKLIKALAK